MQAVIPSQILAQESSGASVASTSGQLQYFFTVLATPTGAALALLAGASIIGVLATKYGLGLLTASAMFCLTTMLHQLSAATNVLIGPLQGLRNVSRPLAVTLLAAAAVASLSVPRGNRLRAAGWTAYCFLAFQLLYNAEYLAFVDPVKGALGVFSVTLMFFVCARTYGCKMQTLEDVRDIVVLCARVGTVFALVNLLQILISPGASTAGGRLIGIAGNAQQLGTLCGLFILSNAFVSQDRSLGHAWRIIAQGTIALLGLMLLWTGSRANIVMTTAGVFMLFRLQVGRLLTFGLVAGTLVAILTITFAESTAQLARFQEAGNTRQEVWAWALENYAESPIFGVLVTGLDSAVESSYISALANTGMIGLSILLVSFAGLVGHCLAAARLKARQPAYGPLCDYFIGTSAAIIVVNAFEGFATGILTLPLMLMYLHFAIGSFIAEAEQIGVADSDLEEFGQFEPGVT